MRHAASACRRTPALLRRRYCQLKLTVPFTRVPVPKCSSALVAESLRGLCNDNLQALTRNGTIVLQNSLPSVRGNLGSNTLEGPELRTADAALSKSFQIGENRSVQIRFDASTIFNHATPNAPAFPYTRSFSGVESGPRGGNLSINNANEFGRIGIKSTTRPRQFQATIRVDF